MQGFLIGVSVGLVVGVTGSIFWLSKVEATVISEVAKLKADVLAAIAIAKAKF
jgi:hypothetical protein